MPGAALSAPSRKVLNAGHSDASSGRIWMLIVGRCERRTSPRGSLALRLAPPGFQEIAVERGRGRAADDGPARDPLRRQMKQRDNVEAREQRAVERAHRR